MNDPLYEYSNRIPAEHQQELLSHKIWINSQLGDLPKASDITRYLFDIWNTYIRPNNQEDITCGRCRSKLANRFRRIIQILENE